jgi:hypothetical protein
MVGTLVHAGLYAAPAMYVDKRDLLLAIVWTYRIYILVFLVLPESWNSSMRLLEYPQATSFSTANSQFEQKVLKSKIAKRRTSRHTRSRHDRTMSSSAVHLDSLLVILIERYFSQYTTPSRITAVSKIEEGLS